MKDPGITWLKSKGDSEHTFAVVLVCVDRLALAKGTEGNHVLVRVERHTVESSGITELRVDRDRITCTK